MNESGLKAYFAKKRRWTEAEKKILLRGLKKYGSQHPEKIRSLLPNKTTYSIEQMIRKYQAIAEFGKKEVNSPLDIWLRSGIFDSDDSLIPEALLFIYLFENHPPPEETAGFDLKNAYKYLYELMIRQPTTSLPRRTAEMMKQLIVTVDRVTWPTNESSTTDYLIGKLCTVQSEKNYKRKKND